MDMTSLLTKRQLADLGQLLVSVGVRILTVPFLMVLGIALLLAVLVGSVGAPAEIVLNFVLEATGVVVVLQGKLLLIFGSIGALCFVVGSYRIDILVSYAAEKLQSKIKGLQILWSLMLAGVRTLFPLPTGPVRRAPRLACTVGTGAGFVPGHTPKLE